MVNVDSEGEGTSLLDNKAMGNSSHSKLALIFTLTGISVLSFYLALQDRHDGGLKITPLVHDFGAVDQGATLVCQVALINDSEYDLECGQALGSCKCAVVESLEGRCIVPGETIEVPISWNISGKRGRVYADMIFNWHAISPSGARGPDFHSAFRCYADVSPEYFVIPEKLEFVAGRSEQKTLQLISNANSLTKYSKTLKFIDFGSNHRCLKVTKAESSGRNAVKDTLGVIFSGEFLSETAGAPTALEIVTMVNSDYEPKFVVPVNIIQPPARDTFSRQGSLQ